MLVLSNKQKCVSNFKSPLFSEASSPLLSLSPVLSVFSSIWLMDFNFMGTFGGWFLFPNCMAKSKASNSETSTKSYMFLLLLGFLFISLVLVHSSDPAKPSMVSAVSSLNSPKTSAAHNTMDVHPRKRQNSHTWREFEAGAHEVPSGPNPISNK